MRGHESVLEVRRQGYGVEHVWVHVLDSDIPRYSFMQDPDNALELGLRPEINIQKSDKPQTLDFRCLLGATVHLIGTDKPRTLAVMRQILRFKPSRIIASGFDEIIDTREGEHEQPAPFAAA